MTEDGGRMTEDRRRMTEDKDGGRTTDGRRQRTDDRWQKTEDRRQRTEDGRQMTEDKTNNVYPEMVDFGSRQGRSPFATAVVVSLRRGSQKGENAVLGQKMPFPDGH